MATAIDVMKYIKSQMNVMGEVQLQKLTYYAQAWSLAWDGKPLFLERIEAWKMGPVVPAIRYRTDEPADDSCLDAAEKATVDAVIEFYGRHHGQALARMTHVEGPWRDARGGLPEGAACNEVISHASMRRFYTLQALTAEVPVRREVAAVANTDEVLDVARANEKRWRGTLRILAQ